MTVPDWAPLGLVAYTAAIYLFARWEAYGDIDEDAELGIIARRVVANVRREREP